MDIREIIRRYRAGQTIRSIASTMGYDRKTVRKYINGLRAKGKLDSETMVENEELVRMLREDATEHGRPSEKQSLLEPYLEELKGLIDKPSGMKPKTAFKVLCGRHDLTGKVSYTSFKRFVRGNQLILNVGSDNLGARATREASNHRIKFLSGSANKHNFRSRLLGGESDPFADPRPCAHHDDSFTLHFIVFLFACSWHCWHNVLRMSRAHALPATA